MLKVGITGGIGSGKTTVSRIFESIGIPVYYADDRAKWLMKNDAQIVRKIKKAFGEEAYTSEGELNRTFLADRVFGDEEQLRRLNRIVHPAVRRDADHWHLNQSGVPYTLKEAALLFESGSYRYLDRIISVTAPRALRIKRVMKRDGVSRGKVLARIEHQIPEAEKVRRS
ncbi:MAG: dephospho-CoA kinase, partial [Saprospiraceae bacterium]|nr:dephospho-CoA kinase [Saprospiraceae bacterium]